MIEEKDAEILAERLVRRVEQMNTYFLSKIGSSIKKIRNLKPSQAQQLVQILKYGGNYEQIIKFISRYTGLSIDEIDNIFENYAEKDLNFYKKFYEYRNIPFVSFDENKAVKMQIKALSNIMKNEMYDFTRSKVLGYTINDKFYNLKDVYNKMLDEALLNVEQGKDIFDAAMTKIMKEIGSSGLKTLEYESGRSVRLDSAVRMHLKSRLRELHNENQKIVGEEIKSDGIEISVHLNPAPDHQDVQGKQFKNSEFEKLQKTGKAKTYDEIDVNMHLERKDGSEIETHRPISEMNCYHYIFAIILGVSEPNYSNKELKDIIDKNNKGFEYEGKHYTNYEGTQLQRKLESEIRKQKDIQILAKESDTKDLIRESQSKITVLTRKYKELSEISGLPTYMERMKVSGYRRIKV